VSHHSHRFYDGGCRPRTHRRGRQPRAAGSNATGISLLGGLLGAKRLELLRELVPSAATIGVLINPNNRDVAAEREELDAAIAKGGQKALIIASGPSDDIEGAIGKFAQNQVDAIIVTADPIFTNRRTQITALVARYRIPAIYQWNLFVSAGGLMSYGTDLEDSARSYGAAASTSMSSPYAIFGTRLNSNGGHVGLSLDASRHRGGGGFRAVTTEPPLIVAERLEPICSRDQLVVRRILLRVFRWDGAPRTERPLFLLLSVLH
jgi:ABC transporter substrate binding protein